MRGACVAAIAALGVCSVVRLFVGDGNAISRMRLRLPVGKTGWSKASRVGRFVSTLDPEPVAGSSSDWDDAGSEDIDDDGWDSELESMMDGSDEGLGVVKQPGTRMKVQLNETMAVEVVQCASASQKFSEIMKGGSGTMVCNMVKSGDTVWGAAVMLARWLASAQGEAGLVQGASVLEVGSGLGLPGVTAARLGAAKVLLQDRDSGPLRSALETALENNVLGKISTIRCAWDEVPATLEGGQADDRLSAAEVQGDDSVAAGGRPSAGEATSAGSGLLGFGSPDVVLGADVLFDFVAVESIAGLLAKLMTREEQVAYFMDRNEYRQPFIARCRELGLQAEELDVHIWHPGGLDFTVGANAWALKLMKVWVEPAAS